MGQGGNESQESATIRVAILNTLKANPDGTTLRQLLAAPAVAPLVEKHNREVVRYAAYCLKTAGLTYITPGTNTALHFITALGAQVLPIYESNL